MMRELWEAIVPQLFAGSAALAGIAAASLAAHLWLDAPAAKETPVTEYGWPSAPITTELP